MADIGGNTNFGLGFWVNSLLVVFSLRRFDCWQKRYAETKRSDGEPDVSVVEMMD